MLKFIRYNFTKDILFNETINTLNKLYKSITVLTVIIVFLPLQIFGFALHDHGELSKIAIKEFFRCVQPEMLSPFNELALNSFTNSIVDGNLQEDTNYLSKALQYSHFYNPNFYVNIEWSYFFDRCPSNYRIHHLEQILEAHLQENNLEVSDLLWDNLCQPSYILSMAGLAPPFSQLFPSKDTSILDLRFFHIINNQTRMPERYRSYFDQLGHAIHHLQDMSSPTHVVPILHPIPFDSPTSSWEILQDGFEHNDNRIFVLNKIASESNTQPLNEICTFKKSTPPKLFNILDQSARSTLNALNQEIIVYIRMPERNRNSQNPYSSSTPITVTWRKWYDVSSAYTNINHLGQYGIYQDAFGLTEFQINDDSSNTSK